MAASAAAFGIGMAVGATRPADPTDWVLPGLAFVAVVAALASVVLEMFLLRPLVALRDAARAAAAGHAHVEVDQQGSDELADLSAEFNRMWRAIRSHDEQLEDSAARLREQQVTTQQERDRLTGVIHSLRDGLFLLDANGKVSLANDIGRRFVTSADDSARLRELSAAELKGQPGLVPADGRIWEVTVAPMHNVHDIAPPGFVGVCRDVTDRVVALERQPVQEGLSMLGEISAGLAHTLNNSLTAVAMFAQLLDDGLPPDSEWREHVAVIRRNTSSCVGAVRSLLQATPTLNCVSGDMICPVSGLLRDVVALVEPLAARSGVRLRTTIPADSECAVNGHPVRLRQAVTQVAINAIQSAGADASVTINARMAADCVMIDVADTGPGVPQEIVGTIFNPFFTTRPDRGTGLGLPTARRLVETHGGQLMLLDSTPGHTVFRFVLPLAHARDATP